MQYSTKEALAINEALNGLGGHAVPVRDGDKATIVIQPFKIKDPETQIRIVLNQKRLKDIVEATAETRDAAFKRLAKDGKIEPDTPERKEWDDEVKRIEAVMVEVKLFPIEYKKLDPTINSYPLPTIQGLLPILVYDEPAEDKAKPAKTAARRRADEASQE